MTTSSGAGASLAGINHIVVLMLENRSFDHMLGYLYAAAGNVSPSGQPFEGLTGNESNPDANGNPVPDATFMISSPTVKKGSDADVAAHPLVDVLTGVVDAAVVVSNDSDLEFPVSYARTRVAAGCDLCPSAALQSISYSSEIAVVRAWPSTK